MIYQEIIEGNRAVVITANDEAGPFRCRVWVNARDGLAGADATLVTYKSNSMPHAIKWAQRRLGIAA